jgi:hypothetical protein
LRGFHARSNRSDGGGCGPGRLSAEINMKSILNRLIQLEVHVAPKVNVRLERAAAIPQERRRLRLETSGLPPEEEVELDWASLNLPPGTRLSCAETLGYALRLKRERMHQTGRGTGTLLESPRLASARKTRNTFRCPARPRGYRIQSSPRASGKWRDGSLGDRGR